MSGFPPPSEAGLESLLREAFEFMPGPDMERLAGIEAVLLRASRRPAPVRRVVLPWWALLLLAGGTAAAAWWAGEKWSEQNNPDVRSSPDTELRATPEPVAPAPPTRVEAGTPEEHGPAQNRGDSRIIYEREAP